MNGVFFPPLADGEQPSSSSFLIFCLQAPSIFSRKRRRGREPLSPSYSSEPRTNAHAFPEKKVRRKKSALRHDSREKGRIRQAFLSGKPVKACTAQHCGGIPRRRRMHSQVDRCRHSRSRTFSKQPLNMPKSDVSAKVRGAPSYLVHALNDRFHPLSCFPWGREKRLAVQPQIHGREETRWGGPNSWKERRPSNCGFPLSRRFSEQKG